MKRRTFIKYSLVAIAALATPKLLVEEEGPFLCSGSGDLNQNLMDDPNATFKIIPPKEVEGFSYTFDYNAKYNYDVIVDTNGATLSETFDQMQALLRGDETSNTLNDVTITYRA